MNMQFLNESDDCKWLRGKLPSSAPAFQSFILYGNEDSPDRADLYASVDPLYTDKYIRADFLDESITFTEV